MVLVLVLMTFLLTARTVDVPYLFIVNHSASVNHAILKRTALGGMVRMARAIRDTALRRRSVCVASA